MENKRICELEFQLNTQESVLQTLRTLLLQNKKEMEGFQREREGFQRERECFENSLRYASNTSVFTPSTSQTKESPFIGE